MPRRTSRMLRTLEVGSNSRRPGDPDGKLRGRFGADRWGVGAFVAAEHLSRAVAGGGVVSPPGVVGS